SEAGKTRKLVLEAGEYVFHEEVAPKGYLKVTDITFLVNEDGSVTVTTDTTTAHASKVDGNKLTVVDEAETTTTTTVSTESTTPSTSATSASTESSTSSTSETSASTESTTPSTTSSTTTTPETPKHEILISKTDLGGEEIAGAKIVVTKDGKEVASWTSEAGKTRKLVLEAGEYVFHEEVAPKGYLKVTDITFLVNEDGSVTVKTDTTTAHSSKTDGNKLAVIDEAEKSMGTTLTGPNGAKEVDLGTIKLTDTIAYKNFPVGDTITFKGELIDKSTGKVVATAESTQTITDSNGTATVVFEFDTRKYAGKDLVAFETAYDASGRIIAEHKDINDKGQTVKVKEEPKRSMGTTLTGLKGAKEVDLGTIKLTDTITYKNFPVGEKITFKGELIDKSTGKVVATAESTQTIADSNGTATVVFEFDTRKYAGKDLVAFETAYDASGRIIAEHKDINDKGQTVKVKEEPNGSTNPPKGSKSGSSGKRTLPSTGTKHIVLLETIGLVVGLGLATVNLRKSRDY
ncbi:VaFE repeat-containing surface-anchored protein, partial [Streptococcus rupicaprae]